jgi:hypothetical protein
MLTTVCSVREKAGAGYPLVLFASSLCSIVGSAVGMMRWDSGAGRTHQAGPALRARLRGGSGILAPQAAIAAVLEAAVGGRSVRAGATSALLPAALRDGNGGAARHACSRDLRVSSRWNNGNGMYAI